MATLIGALWLGDYRVALAFDDGVRGVVDLSDLREGGGVFAPLRDPAAFGRVQLMNGTLGWPEIDVDLAPEPLHEEAARWSKAHAASMLEFPDASDHGRD